MKKHGSKWLIYLACGLLTGCIGGVWTGANLIYDRHHVYKLLNDYQLAADAQHYLFDDRVLKQPGCALGLAVFNGDILLVGHVPDLSLKSTIEQRLGLLNGYRRLFNQVKVSQSPSRSLEDSWTTIKIRSRIFADSSIDPNTFKIVTADGIVYLMGDVKSEQAKKIIKIARTTTGVVRVVKLLRVYALSTE